VRRTAVVALAMVVMGLIACDEEKPEKDHIPIRDIRNEDDGPYGIVAVDNHFHDIHPEDDITLDADQTVFVRNDGSNLHNFSIAGTDVSEELEPGDKVRWSPIGDELEPGTYEVFCKYHSDVGMTGRFEVSFPGMVPD
jgi:Cupredoxin-like domain